MDVEPGRVLSDRVVLLAPPPVPVEYPMSSTMEVEYDAAGNIVATPPTDYDG